MKNVRWGRALAAGMMYVAGTSGAHAGPFLAFTPDPALEQDAGSLSPEGCYHEPGLARGALTASSSATTCHSGQWGSDSNVDNCGGVACEPFDQSQAIFDSAPLSAPLQVGGPATLVAYYYAAYERGPGGTNDPNLPTTAYLEYALEDTAPGDLGNWTIARGRAFQLSGQSGGVHRGEGTILIGPYTIPAGHVLRVRLTSSAAPDGRLLFGGAPLASTPSNGARPPYADAGITLATSAGEGGGGGTFGAAGALPVALLAPFALVALLRGRHTVAALVAAVSCFGTPASANDSLTLAFTPGPMAGPVSPEGCYLDEGLAHGTLAPPSQAAATCHSGLFGNGLGVFSSDPAFPDTWVTADFTSAPFTAGLVLAGPATISVHYADPPAGAGGPAVDDLFARLGYWLEEVRPDGTSAFLAGGTAIEHLYLGLSPQTASFDVGPHALAAGSRLRLRLYAGEVSGQNPCELPTVIVDPRFPPPPPEPPTAPECDVPPEAPQPHPFAAGARLLYGGTSLLGGGDYHGSSITFARQGNDAQSSPLSSLTAGALPATLLVPLLGMAFARRRRAG